MSLQSLQPMRMHTLQLKNRIMFPAMSTKYAAIDGQVTDRMLNYYEARAKGGVGLVMVEATYIEQSGNAFSRGLGLDHDRFIRGLEKLVTRVHRHGAKIGIQLHHAGRAALVQYSGSPIYVVSYVPDLCSYEDSNVLDAFDIERLEDAWAAAATRAQKAGFDCVELHGAHGYLLHQFMSPLTNTRTDEYGGSLANRMRFPLEVLRKTREAVGSEYPVLYRLSAVDGLPHGLTLEDSGALAAHLVQEGVNALHVSVGLRETNFMIGPPACVPKGWNAPLARYIKDVTQNAVPVVVAGRVVDLATAETIFASGDADMVAMGRALIADPDLIAKTQAGQEAQIIACINCNEGCVGGAAKGTGIACALNPLVGAEGKYGCAAAATPRNVLVIGGGVAGMQAALTARQQGHHVTLFDERPELGGLLHLAHKPPFKDNLCGITARYTHELHRLGVKLELGQHACLETVQRLAPEAILIATGSTPLVPDFLQHAPHTLTAAQALEGAPTGHNIVIIGGGLIGCELAEWLVEQDKHVTVLEMRPQMAMDMEPRTRRYLMERFRTSSVNLLVNTKVMEITPQGDIRVQSEERGEYWLEHTDTLVIAVGYKPEKTLADQLAHAGYAPVCIGDCLGAGKIMAAIQQGFQAGLAL